MNRINVTEVDKYLEMALLIRGAESGYVRDRWQGPVVGYEGDVCRLDAFTLGLLDELAARIGTRDDWRPLLVYLFQLNENGPGEIARRSYQQMCDLNDVPALARYIVGGRQRIRRALEGDNTDIGRFARLLIEEHDES
jgi:hypothetical protein